MPPLTGLRKCAGERFYKYRAPTELQSHLSWAFYKHSAPNGAGDICRGPVLER